MAPAAARVEVVSGEDGAGKGGDTHQQEKKAQEGPLAAEGTGEIVEKAAPVARGGRD